MPLEPTDVIVIGAGPVGVTLACELKRHGARVRLIDKKAEPNPHPNAAIVHVRTLEIFAAMGAVDGFLKEGYPFPGIHAHINGRHAAFLDLAGLDSPYPVPRTLGQQITERILREHFAKLGGEVERPVEAVGFEQDADGVRVHLRHLADGNREEVAAARYVVGCEGSASITRETAKIDFPGERYVGTEFLQADVNVRWTYPHGFGYQFMTGDLMVLFFAYDKEGHYRIISARPDQDPENKNPPTLEEMQEVVRLAADPAAELYDPAWMNRFRSGHRIAKTFREGRAFLAGDAGHVHVPIGGQGMNYGMHDAFNLGWKLAAVLKGEANHELLDTYQTERHGADEMLIKGTDFAFHALLGGGAVHRAALKTIAPVMMNLDVVQKRVRNTLGELNVAYPESTLSEDHGGSHGPVAGDRALDAIVVTMPGRKTTTVFDVMHGTRWTLLLLAGHQPIESDVESLEKMAGPIAQKYGARIATHLVLCGEPPVPVHESWAANVLMDRERFVHQKYGVATSPCLYLIRPDWHIAFRGGLEHADHLRKYLERIFN
jgi:2-polyprenyl-6-methoxyphenol hydroxylase-like FAD-dependent oxidoreductase